MSTDPAETEITFLVPAESRAALAAELAGRPGARRQRLQAAYLDTPDLRLARAGLAWRLRREDGRWVQALKAARGPLERFEHEVERPDATPDAAAHAGTAPGRELAALLDAAAEAGQAVGPRFQADVRRLSRRVRTRGAVVDIALDQGRLTADAGVQRLCEVEFERVSGSTAAMLALAERWRGRFGLVLEPRNKAERGLALAAGAPQAPLRKAGAPRYGRGADALHALAAVCDECLDHIGRSAIGVTEGDAAQRPEHVHQLRVGIRRLRSALRAFRGWVAEPPAALVQGLKALFAALGEVRDREVLGSGVDAELARAGAPPLALPDEAPAPDAAALVRSPDTQRLLLSWVAWRAGLQATEDAPAELKRAARRRLHRWHQALAAAWRGFDDLDAAALHALRKHVKRQRYAVEFFAPLLPRKRTARYLVALAAAQQALGEVNDLAVARARYESRVADDPAAWFAVGWLAARQAPLRAEAGRALGELAALASPGR